MATTTVANQTIQSISGIKKKKRKKKKFGNVAREDLREPRRNGGFAAGIWLKAGNLKIDKALPA